MKAPTLMTVAKQLQRRVMQTIGSSATEPALDPLIAGRHAGAGSSRRSPFIDGALELGSVW
jgi:hypothetical protein